MSDENEETRTLTLSVYRTPDGRPTCCRDGWAGDLCQMLGYTTRGSVCRFTGAAVMPYAWDAGPWLQPPGDCPLWRDGGGDE